MFDLEEINYLANTDPQRLCDESENAYNQHVEEAAELIVKNMDKSRIVFISGPSSSGKTTTASKIDNALERRGIKTEHISMDDYYLTHSEATPRTPDGNFDYESPLCLDSELLNLHLAYLAEGKAIEIPSFDFKTQSRSDKTSHMKLGDNNVVIVEGIHALNPAYTSSNPDAFKLYIATKSDVYYKDEKIFDKTWFRLVRRIVRDDKFRGYEAEETLFNWANIRRGEKLYIDPYTDDVDYTFDTCFMSELSVLAAPATELIISNPTLAVRYPILDVMVPAINLFTQISETFVANDSLLREFIG